MWKEDFMHDRFATQEKQRLTEINNEKKLQVSSRRDMIIKYFAEKVSPTIHDAAARKESFAEWKEAFMHDIFGKREGEIQKGHDLGVQEAEARRKKEAALERKIRKKTMSDKMIKYFGEKVPAVHDLAAKKEGFGTWKEQFVHERFLKQEAALRDAHKQSHDDAEQRRQNQFALERKIHKKTQSAKLLKYFSEKVSPGVHDVAAKKEGFGTWKEDFVHSCYAADEKKRKEQQAREKKIHNKTRSDMMVKLFSEKISPAVHDLAAKKEGFGILKEQFVHESFAEHERELHNNHNLRHEEQVRQAREAALERQVHLKSRSALVVKLFSEKISPAVHDGAAKQEAWGVWKEDFMHHRFGNEEARRLKQHAAEKKVHKNARSNMMIKYFSEKVSPAIHDVAVKKEGFGVWREDYMHVVEQQRRDDHDLSHVQAEERRRKEFALERKIHKKTQSAKMMKYFSEKVAPGVHDVAAKKEGFGTWKEQFLHESFEEREAVLRGKHNENHEEHERRHKQLALEHELHKKTQSAKMLKYFSEKVSPGVHDVAAKKEALGAWKEEFIHDKYALEQARRNEQRKSEQKVHKQTRSNMMIKYFSEKVSPALHDKAVKKEGFGVWREQSMHENFASQERMLQSDLKLRHEEEARLRKQHALEKQLHTTTRSDMMVKYFADKVGPVHDVAAKKEGFGVWKEDYIHDSYGQAEARRLREHAKERAVHKNTRSGMMLKYFSEKVSPATHDKAAKHEGFGVWKEDFMHDRFAKQEEWLKAGHKQSHTEAEQRRQAQFALERKLHKKTQSSKMIKYFSEKVAPGVHDVAAKKEAFGAWKEDFVHDCYAVEERMRQEQQAKERKLHKKTRSDAMIKYFAEKVSPAVHDVASKKEAFGYWKEEFIHQNFEDQEKGHQQALREKHEAEARRLQEQALERKIHKKTRSDMMIKYFSEKISPAVHDKAVKKEGFGIWKEDFMHDRFATQEQARAEAHKRSHDDAEERRQKQFALERKLHKKTQSAKMLKYFSEKVSPGVHDVAAKKEAMGVWKEDFIHDRYAKDEARRLRRQNVEKRLHKNTRSNMMIKYFSEKVGPVHDLAAKKEGFGIFKEEFIHTGYADEAEKRRKQHALEKKLHKKTRSDMMIKYFSEKVSPAVHDKAARKEGFGVWKEQFLVVSFAAYEERLHKQREQNHDEHEKRHAQHALERKIHNKTRSDMMIKYFSEKISPQVHDKAVKKHGWGIWKEDYIHSSWQSKHTAVHTQFSEKITEAEARQAELKLERKIHLKSRSDMIVK